MQVSDHVHALRIPFAIKTEMGALDRFVYAFLIYGPQICLIDYINKREHFSSHYYNAADWAGFSDQKPASL